MAAIPTIESRLYEAVARQGLFIRNPETTRRYGVLGMPTLALFVGGEPVVQFTGARPRAAILRELEPHLGARVSA